MQYYSIPDLGDANLFKFKYDQNKQKELHSFFEEHKEMKRKYNEKHDQYPEFWDPVLGVIKYPFIDPKQALNKQFQ